MKKKKVNPYRLINWLIAVSGLLTAFVLSWSVVLVMIVRQEIQWSALLFVIAAFGLFALIVLTFLLWRSVDRKVRRKMGRFGQDPLLPKDDAALPRKKQYAEDLSHELLTPIAVLNSKIELLLQSPNLGEEEMVLVDGMMQTLNRLSRTNRGLILLSKIDHGLFLDSVEVSLTELLRSTLDNFEDQIRQRKLKVRMDVDENVILVTNRNLIEILVSNLMKNAVVHNLEGGDLKIALHQEYLRIENSGRESENVPDELFTRFVSESTSKGSVGLGLSIVKKICVSLEYTLSYVQANNKHILTVRF